MLTVMQSYKASTTVAALLSFHALFIEVYTSTFLLEGRLLAGTCFFFSYSLHMHVSFSGLVQGHTFQYLAKTSHVIRLTFWTDSDL